MPEGATPPRPGLARVALGVITAGCALAALGDAFHAGSLHAFWSQYPPTPPPEGSRSWSPEDPFRGMGSKALGWGSALIGLGLIALIASAVLGRVEPGLRRAIVGWLAITGVSVALGSARLWAYTPGSSAFRLSLTPALLYAAGFVALTWHARGARLLGLAGALFLASRPILLRVSSAEHVRATALPHATAESVALMLSPFVVGALAYFLLGAAFLTLANPRWPLRPQGREVPHDG